MRASAVSLRYEAPPKATAREVVIRAATGPTYDSMRVSPPESILDLWGGGGSAKAFREAFPDAAIVSCEVDEQLWPTLRQEAQRNDYVAHCGDFRTAGGFYDLVWLDLCGQWSKKARDLVAAGSRMTTADGILAVTLLAAREDPLIADDRLWVVPNSIERHTGMKVVVLYPYQSGSPMWLLILTRRDRTAWSLEPSRFPSDFGLSPFEMVMEDMREKGYVDSLFYAVPDEEEVAA
jgi:hypothetical protein